VVFKATNFEAEDGKVEEGSTHLPEWELTNFQGLSVDTVPEWHYVSDEMQRTTVKGEKRKATTPSLRGN
jgi:hypothetical protein